MAPSRPQFTIAGVPVRLELTFFLIVGLLGVAVAPTFALLAAWISVATLSILLHEMGHALAYKAFGHPSHVVLMGFGGVTTGPRLSPGRSIVVSLAGPLSGILLLGLPALALSRLDVVERAEPRLVLFYFVWVNLVWAFVNLLPVLPLDGGNVVQSFLQLVTGRDAERPTRVLSIVVAGAATLFALLNGYLFGALFGGFVVALNVNALRQAKLPEVRAGLGRAQQALAAGRLDEASALADEVVAQRPPRDLLAVALEIGAWARLLAGDHVGAEARLRRLPNEVRPPATLTGAAALVAGRVDEGLTLMAWGFVHDRDEGSKVFATAVAAAHGQAVPLVTSLLALDGGTGLESAWKVQATLHQLGRYDDAVAVARVLVTDGRVPAGEVGYHAARSLARAGDADGAIRWLSWVLDQGPLDAARLAADPDLAPLRTHPAWPTLTTRAAAH